MLIVKANGIRVYLDLRSVLTVFYGNADIIRVPGVAIFAVTAIVASLKTENLVITSNLFSFFQFYLISISISHDQNSRYSGQGKVDSEWRKYVDTRIHTRIPRSIWSTSDPWRMRLKHIDLFLFSIQLFTFSNLKILIMKMFRFERKKHRKEKSENAV